MGFSRLESLRVPGYEGVDRLINRTMTVVPRNRQVLTFEFWEEKMSLEELNSGLVSDLSGGCRQRSARAVVS